VNALGGVALVTIDTTAAYFEGDDENSNVQMGRYARGQRSLVELPGGPCVVALCHPVKNAGLVDRVDLSPIINSYKIFRPLRKNEARVETAHLIDDGDVVAWTTTPAPNAGPDLDTAPRLRSVNYMVDHICEPISSNRSTSADLPKSLQGAVK